MATGSVVRGLLGLVGLGMFLGFGAIFVTEWQELRAFPDTPTPMTVHDAVTLESPELGAWIELVDVRFPCDQPEQVAGKSQYRLGFGETDDDRIIVSGRRACSDAPVRVSGVLDTASPGRIVGLEFPGYGFERWPRPWQSTLWTSSGPEDSRIALVILPPFALMGLIVIAFFWKPAPTRSAKLEVLSREPSGPPWTEGERVLPARPLQLAQSSLYDRVLSFSTLFVISWMMSALAWFSFTSMEGAFGVIAGLFFALLAAAVLFAMIKAAWALTRDRKSEGPRVEALVKLERRRPMEGGSVILGFTHPLTGEAMERVITLQESAALVVGGYVLLVWGEDPRAAQIVREDFSPFDLTPTEQRESLRRLLRWVNSRGA